MKPQYEFARTPKIANATETGSSACCAAVGSGMWSRLRGESRRPSGGEGLTGLGKITALQESGEVCKHGDEEDVLFYDVFWIVFIYLVSLVVSRVYCYQCFFRSFFLINHYTVKDPLSRAALDAPGLLKFFLPSSCEHVGQLFAAVGYHLHAKSGISVLRTLVAPSLCKKRMSSSELTLVFYRASQR